MRNLLNKFFCLLLIVTIIFTLSVSAFAVNIDGFANASENSTGDTILFYVVIAVTAFCGLVGVLVFGGNQKKN